MDGVGEWCTTSTAIGHGRHLDIKRRMPFPAFARAAVFGLHLLHRLQGQFRRVQGDGPRPLWRAEIHHAQTILDHLIDLKADGSFRLDQNYFDYCTGLTMTNERFAKLFGQPRTRSDMLTPFHMVYRRISVQAVTEDHAAAPRPRATAKETGQSNLCLAGGVAA
ncbi:MAG: carbamoyltransferase N-terminal domain-containing protein [Xanthobacteraceae bacterium]